MLRLNTLGTVSIEFGEERLTPAGSHVFALALILVSERPRQLSRNRLEALLFSEATQSSASHRLRQIVYKLRKLGFPMASTSAGIGLGDVEVWDDASEFLRKAIAPGDPLPLADGGYLPGYSPDFSAGYAEWLEERRSRINLALRRRLLSWAADAKAVANWAWMEACSRTCLSIDPLNEEATLCLAEALVLAGSKSEALSLLNRYEQAVDGSAISLRLSPSLLRRRIEAHPADGHEEFTRPPLVGRTEAMRCVKRVATDALAGRGSSLTFCGSRGFGKSRILDEAALALRLDGFRVVGWKCPRQHLRQPLGDVQHILERIRELPGALGTDPASLALLTSLSNGRPADVPGRARVDVFWASADLLRAVTSEAPLAILVDDVDCSDEHSRTILASLSARCCDLRLVILFTANAAPTGRSDGSIVELAPLSRADSEALARSVLPDDVRSDVVDYLVANSNGVPGDLTTLSQHYRTYGKLAVPSELAALWRHCLRELSQEGRLTVEAVALLRSHATVEATQATTGLATTRFASALRELESSRLVLATNGTLVCNELFRDVVIAETPTSVRSLLSQRAGTHLISAAQRSGNTDTYWAAVDQLRIGGNIALAPRVVIACAENATCLGQPREAAALLREARQISSAPRDRISLTRALAGACYAAGDWAGVVDAAEALPQGQIDPRLTRLVRDAKREMGDEHPDRGIQSPASLGRGTNAEDILDQLTSDFLYAEQALDDDRARNSYLNALPLLKEAAGTISAIRLTVFFNTLFGDRDIAKQYATVGAALLHSPAGSRRALPEWCSLGYALSLLGAIDDAQALYDELLRRSISPRLPGVELLVRASKVSAFLEHGRISEAAQEHRECIRLMQSVGDKATPVLFYANWVHLALARGAPDDAAEKLKRIRDQWPSANGGRYAIVMAALDAAVAYGRGEPCPPSTIALLSKGVERLSPRRLYDEPIEGLLQALISVGRRDAATILAETYFRKDRDPRAAILPRTAKLLTKLELSVPPSTTAQVELPAGAPHRAPLPHAV